MMSSRPSSLCFLACLLFGGVLCSCQSVEFNGATREEKSAALASHLEDWAHPTLVNQFARTRTIQVFNNLVLDSRNGQIDASSNGQATLLTPDGYALTATHVLKQGPASVLQLKSPRAGRVSLTPAGPVLHSPRHPDRSLRLALEDIEPHPIRTVHRFRGSDLALVKLPLQASQTFQLVSAPPEKGSTLFSYGSNLSGNSSAGKTLHTSRKRSLKPNTAIWTVSSSIPLQKGDSGGPVMNSEGSLVGIISRGYVDLSGRGLHSTIAVGISPETLRELIDKDRATP